MICRNCLRRAAVQLITTSVQRTAQAFSTTTSPRNAIPVPASKVPNDLKLVTPQDSNAVAEAKPALSSCPAGTPLQGLNYLKNRHDPVALADEEYPEWLWDCINVTKKKASDTSAEEGDEFSKSRKQRRVAAKKKAKFEAKILASGDLSALAPKIPVTEQTINLPDGMSPQKALAAADAREALTRAMHKDRKQKIKEANYLKSM